MSIAGVFEAWNPYPEPGSLALALPGGGRIEALGRVGITRFTAFIKQGRVAIDGAQPGAGRATVAVLSGFATAPTVPPVALVSQP